MDWSATEKKKIIVIIKNKNKTYTRIRFFFNTLSAYNGNIKQKIMLFERSFALTRLKIL